MHKKKIAAAMAFFSLFLFPMTVSAETEAKEFTDGAELALDVTDTENSGYLPIEEDDMAPVVEKESEMTLFAASSTPSKWNPLDGNTGYTLPAIRDQSPYGSCWAFATNAAQELSLLRTNQGTKDLSELQLAYFTYHSVTDPLGGTDGDSVTYTGSVNYLEKGGNYSYATAALMNWVGAADESRVPYSQAGASISNGLEASLAYGADVAHLQNVYQINIKQNRDEVKKMIQEYGAAAVTFADENYYFTTATNAYYNPNDERVNHGVAIVGWDDSFSKNNFTQSPSRPSSDGAWLIRNSWGGNGMDRNGYFWMSYEDASLSDTAYVMIAEDASNYDHNYIYDGSIASSGWGGVSSVSGANVYTVHGGSKVQSLEAVSFYAYSSSDVDYTVEIYVNPTDGNNPRSGQKIDEATTSGRTRYAGYYTIPLNESVLLVEGDQVAVVVTLKKDGGQVWLGKEYTSEPSGIRAIASAKEGQSFFCQPDGTWIDFGKKQNSNFRINAYTKDRNDVEVHTLTLDANGGSIANSQKSVIKGHWYGNLGTPTRGSLEFAGWYTEKEGGTKVNASDVYTLSANQTLYAHWKGFEKDGEELLYVYDDNGKIKKNQFVCDGTYTYFLQNDGTPMKDRLTYHPNGKEIIYFDSKGHEVFDNFVNVKRSIAGEAVDDICYFNTFGYMYVDKTTYDRAGEKLYYLNPYGVMQQNGWFRFSDGNIGFANWDGTLMTSQFSYDQWNRLVYFQGNGTLARGLITDGVNYYQMDENDGHCIGIFQ